MTAVSFIAERHAINRQCIHEFYLRDFLYFSIFKANNILPFIIEEEFLGFLLFLDQVFDQPESEKEKERIINTSWPWPNQRQIFARKHHLTQSKKLYPN
jgi:hypothetical protein